MAKVPEKESKVLETDMGVTILTVITAFPWARAPAAKQRNNKTRKLIGFISLIG
jgi:hypothetical protein